MRQLALSSSIRLARIKKLANEGPQTKLGYDIVNQTFFFNFLLIVYDTLTKRGEWAISDWTDLGINSGAQVTWANKPTAYIHIPVEVK